MPSPSLAPSGLPVPTESPQHMVPRAVSLGAVALAVLAGVPPNAPRAAEPPALSPPVLTRPADDPDDARCFEPSASTGVILDWTLGNEGAAKSHPIGSYLDVRRRTRGTHEWRPWIRRYARPPFTMITRSPTYDSEFAWHVWAVDRSGRLEPYAVSSAWHFFCTRPSEQPPAYGSSTPRRSRR